MEKFKKIQELFVRYVYGDHNNSPSVKKALKPLIESLNDPGRSGLNIGSGTTHLHPKIKNLDIFPGKYVDIVAQAENVPCENESFDVIVTQETLEHVRDPFKAMVEIKRLLKKDGKAYIQLPFTIGYHPGPTDFWRFTREGITELALRNDLKIIDFGITVGGGSGYYRISVEFFSCLVAIPLFFAYKPLKLLFSVVLLPLKLFDILFKLSKQKDRIPGGYYIIAQK
jgi:SAM-dependent methyltransferase